MTPCPIYRCKCFWLGILVPGFLGWARVDWFPMLLFLVPWSAVIAWRWQRQRKLTA